MAAQVAVLPAGGGDSPVVRLRAAGGEKDALRFCTKGIGNGFAGVFEFALGLDPQIVNRRGVSPVIAE